MQNKIHKGVVFDHIHEYNPKRILHIGGHKAEEGKTYDKIGADVTFVEPVPEYAEIIRQKGYDVIEVAVGPERGEKEFNVRGVFSSFLIRKKDHLPYQDWWLDKVGEDKRQIKVKVVPLRDIQEGYDTIVVDTEGTGLDVLKSGDLNFKTIVIEITVDGAVYEGEPEIDELEEYIISQGYRKDKQFRLDTVFVKV